MDDNSEVIISDRTRKIKDAIVILNNVAEQIYKGKYTRTIYAPENSEYNEELYKLSITIEFSVKHINLYNIDDKITIMMYNYTHERYINMFVNTFTIYSIEDNKIFAFLDEENPKERLVMLYFL